MRNEIRLVELYVPFGLFGAAVLSLVIGAVVFMRRRGPTIDLRAPSPSDAQLGPERQPIPIGTPR
jgi:hypothetical protein